jgi:hypothetical protein
VSRLYLKTDRIQFPKHCVLKYKQDSVLDKKRMMDNVQKHNICIKLSDGSLIFCTLQVDRWVFGMKKNHKLQIFKNKVVRKISGSEKDVIGRRITKKLYNETLNDLHTCYNS